MRWVHTFRCILPAGCEYRGGKGGGGEGEGYGFDHDLASRVAPGLNDGKAGELLSKKKMKAAR